MTETGILNREIAAENPGAESVGGVVRAHGKVLHVAPPCADVAARARHGDIYLVSAARARRGRIGVGYVHPFRIIWDIDGFVIKQFIIALFYGDRQSNPAHITPFTLLPAVCGSFSDARRAESRFISFSLIRV